jgi:multicomponent K+:H+ antiporter subunit E
MLFASWLLLVGSVSAGQIVLAATLATAIPLWSERLRPDRARVGAWGEVLRLALIVLYDIVASALVVARQILGSEERIRPGFVWVPLAIRDPYGVASLASIITMTPGTLSVDLSADRHHVALIASVKERYERPLMAIFEGMPR